MVVLTSSSEIGPNFDRNELRPNFERSCTELRTKLAEVGAKLKFDRSSSEVLNLRSFEVKTYFLCLLYLAKITKINFNNIHFQLCLEYVRSLCDIVSVHMFSLRLIWSSHSSESGVRLEFPALCHQPKQHRGICWPHCKREG